jgi:hypothetical protein
MDVEKLLRAETLFNQLEKYKSPKFHRNIQELREIFQPIIDNEYNKQAKKKHLDKYSYGYYTPSKKVSNVIESLTNAISFYEEAYANVGKMNNAQIDLLHKIEILDLSEEELLQSAKELQEVQFIRREAKDFVHLMEDFYTLACELKDKGYLKRLGRVASDINTKMENLESRTYKVRDKTALAEAFEKAKELQEV